MEQFTTEYSIAGQKVTLEEAYIKGQRPYIDVQTDDKKDSKFRQGLADRIYKDLQKMDVECTVRLPGNNVVSLANRKSVPEVKSVLAALEIDLPTESKLEEWLGLVTAHHRDQDAGHWQAEIGRRVQPLAAAAEQFFAEKKGVRLSDDEREGLLEVLKVAQSKIRQS